MQSLEDLLNQPATPQTSPEPQDSPKTGEAEQPGPAAERPHEGAPAANAGQQTGVPGVPPTPEQKTDEDPKVLAFQRKAEDETRKRQALEREAAELRAHMAEIQRANQQRQQPQPQQQQVPQFLDPEAVQYLQQYVDQALQQNATTHQQALFETRVVHSQELMRSRHSDYEQVEQIFADAMNRDPSLYQQMSAHPMPALFAYQVGKKIQALDEIGSDPTAYREKMKAEILAELKASEAAQPQNALSSQPAPIPQAPPPPPSLAGVPSATGQRAQAYQGPTPLDQILSQPIGGPRHR